MTPAPEKPPEPEPQTLLNIPREASPTGDGVSKARLMDEMYEKIRGLAYKLMSEERRGHTLQPTALAHEAYARILEGERDRWASPAHFYRVVAETMRCVLVDHARVRGAIKRGGGRARLDIDLADRAAEDEQPDWPELDTALRALADFSDELHTVVMLRVFAGLSVEQTAKVLAVSERTVKRRWKDARDWLLAYAAREYTLPP